MAKFGEILISSCPEPVEGKDLPAEQILWLAGRNTVMKKAITLLRKRQLVLEEFAM